MKKIVFVAILGVALLFGGCNKKLVSTQYTIGCLGYQYGSVEGSDWEELQSYFSSHVEYNKLITFESKTLAENDAKATQYFDEQVKKLDTGYICSLLNDLDYFEYGIATLNIDGSYRYVRLVRFEESGMTEINKN